MASKYFFSAVALAELNTAEYNGFDTQSVFLTLPWLRFVAEDSHTEPVIVRITDAEGLVGYFTGMKFKKFGIPLLGSPFPGWSTCHMGILTDRPEEKCTIYQQLIPYLYKLTGCLYIEINDRDVSVEQAKQAGFKTKSVGTLELSIDMDDAGLMKQMKVDCRNFVRQFERRGARLEIAQPDDTFAQQYYTQLEDVFAKQGLVPTYSLEKVKTLLRNLKDTGKVLCLRVISPDERCIATSIFLGNKEKCYFWGGASFRPDQHYRPNEYMIYTAMRHWRDQGCKVFDMVGIRDYKRKFGSHDVHYAALICSRIPGLLAGRDLAARLYYAMGAVKGKLLKRK